MNNHKLTSKRRRYNLEIEQPVAPQAQHRLRGGTIQSGMKKLTGMEEHMKKRIATIMMAGVLAASLLAGCGGSSSSGSSAPAAEPAAEAPKEEQASSSEPGWIKKRVEKAVSKAVAETEARMQAMFDEQMAPLRAKMLEDEAKELVRTGAVKDLELAKEVIRRVIC